MNYILIPLFNEAENIPNLFSELSCYLKENNETVKFVFVDDHSTDSTVALLEQYFKDFNFKIITKNENKGPGDSFNLGFQHVLTEADDHDKVITLEADCTSDLGILKDMMYLSNSGFSLVLASIYVQSGGFDNTKWLRKTLSFFANFLLRFAFDIKVLTLSSFYRIYQVGLLRKVANSYSSIIEEKGFISMIEVLHKCILQEAKVIEYPMVLKSDKRIGKSKMKIFKTIKSYLRFVTKILIRNGY